MRLISQSEIIKSIETTLQAAGLLCESLTLPKTSRLHRTKLKPLN